MFFITRNNKIYYITLTVNILTLKYFMILFFCSATILAQSKEEVKSAKKQVRIDKKIKKQQERTTQKILALESPFWLQIDEKDKSLGLINYDPRRGISYSCRGSDCVLRMIRIVCYWVKAIEKLQIDIVDPCNNGNYINNILLVISAEDISEIRKFRVKDLDSKEIIANNNGGSKIPLEIYDKISNQIFQNCASFMNINR